jgi:hypothetical protein
VRLASGPKSHRTTPAMGIRNCGNDQTRMIDTDAH